MFFSSCLLRIVFAFFLFVVMSSEPLAQNATPRQSKSGRIEIRFTSAVAPRLNDDLDGVIHSPSGLPDLDRLLSEYTNATLTPLFTHDPVSIRNPNFYRLGMDRFYVFECHSVLELDRSGVADLCSRFLAMDGIEIAMPVGVCHLLYIPNDYAIANRDSWGLDSMHCPQAWDIQTGNDEILVTTIDVGVNYLHEDLCDNIAINPLEDVDCNGRLSPADNNGIDDDHNGFIDDVVGWDFQSVAAEQIHYPLVQGEDYGIPDNSPLDAHSHGTHVAGLIAGRTNNGIGIASGSHNVSNLALRAGYAIIYNGHLNGDGAADDFARATQYASNRGVRVISYSFGYDDPDSAWSAAISYARLNGSIVFAAAGNYSSFLPMYPAAYPDVIAVAALDRGNIRASFSNHGSWIGISAPGVGIWSSVINGYACYSGTSMAAPVAASIAALLLARNPLQTPAQVQNTLYQTAVDISQLNPNRLLGAGAIDALAALQSTPERPLLVLAPNMPQDTLWLNHPYTTRWCDLLSWNVRIEQTFNFPYEQWELLLPSTPNDGEQTWMPTGTASSRYRLRIVSNTNEQWSDRSDNNLTLAQPYLTLQSHNHGSYYSCARDTIRWRKGGVNQVTVEWNRNYPNGSWETIAENVTASNGDIPWLIPHSPTNRARVRITDVSYPTLQDVSEQNFSVESSELQFTNYLGGDTILAGATITLKWRSLGVYDTLSLFYMTDYPNGNWEKLPVLISNTDSCRVTIPANIDNRHFRFRLYWNLDTLVQTISEEDILVIAKYLQIHSPNGGEYWGFSEIRNIEWECNFASMVILQIDRNYPSNQWTNLTDPIPNSGSYAWLVTLPYSTRNRIRIVSFDAPSKGDTSDADFTIGATSIAGQITNIPVRFVLSEPYPNPSNGAVAIRFGLPASSPVTIDIFDVQGRVLERLFTGNQNQGYHTLYWNPAARNGATFTSGMYFVRVSTATGSYLTKGVLLR